MAELMAGRGKTVKNRGNSGLAVRAGRRPVPLPNPHPAAGSC